MINVLCCFCHAQTADGTAPHGTEPCPEFLREHEARLKEIYAKTLLLEAQAAATVRNR